MAKTKVVHLRSSCWTPITRGRTQRAINRMTRRGWTLHDTVKVPTGIQLIFTRD